MIAHAQNCNICGMKEPKKTQQISNNEREIERHREREGEGEELKRGVSIACDPDLHLPPSLAGLSVASAINHCQVSFALVDGSSSILYPCSFDSAASQVFHSTHTEKGTVPHTHMGYRSSMCICPAAKRCITGNSNGSSSSSSSSSTSRSSRAGAGEGSHSTRAAQQQQQQQQKKVAN